MSPAAAHEAISCARHRRGFTLVELLVVIAIIAVLIAVLLPVLGRARERSNAVRCSSNLRTILQAHSVYMAENPKRIVWQGLNTITNHFDRRNTDSSVYVSDGVEYLRYGKLLDFRAVKLANFFCPSSPLNEPGIDYQVFGLAGAVPLDARYATYAMRGAKQGGPSNAREWSRGRAQAVLSDFEFRNQSSWYPGDLRIYAHKKGVNVGYTDGHVQYVLGDWDSFYSTFGSDSSPVKKDGTWRKLDEAAK